MIKRIVIACALALAACGQAEQKQETVSPVAGAPGRDATIGPNGAAGIRAALPMSVDDIRLAAPHYTVAAVEDQVEGEPFTAITLSSGDEEMFRVYPTPDRQHVHAISTRSPQARGPTEDIISVTTFAVAPPEQVPFCISEVVDGAPGFACATAADATFWRVYRLPDGYDGPSDPFDAIDPDVLHDATLAEMRWIAPRVE